jgi:hypothetical protein
MFIDFEILSTEVFCLPFCLPDFLFKITILVLQIIELFIDIFLQFLKIPDFLKVMKVLPDLHVPGLSSEF